MHSGGEPIMEVEGTFDSAGNFIVQDSGNLFGQGKSLLKPEVAHHIAQQSGSSGQMKMMLMPGSQQTPHSRSQMVTDPRWLTQSTGRGGKVMPRKSDMGGHITGRFMEGPTPESLRLAAAVTGTSTRGRPRGRRPLRGQFPVVPIDMVRQLGIEQQVVLHPAFPSAMRNKACLSKPLTMTKMTNCNPTWADNDTQTVGRSITEEEEENQDKETGTEPATAVDASTDTAPKKRKVTHMIPIPIPIFVPVPCPMYSNPVPIALPVPIPTPLPVAVLLDGPKEGESFLRDVMVTHPKVKSADISSDTTEHMLVTAEDTTTEKASGVKRPSPDATTGASDAKQARATVVSDVGFRLKFSYGINAWRHWVNARKDSTFAMELLDIPVKDLARALVLFVKEVRKPNRESYVADSIFYLCLGIQEYLNVNGRDVNLFARPLFSNFTQALDDILSSFEPRISPDGLLICRIEEAHLWEAGQLDDRSPEALLFTMLYLNTKNFGLRTVSAHRSMRLTQMTLTDHVMKYQPEGTDSTLDVPENTEFSGKCPVRLYKTYLNKCPPEIVDRSEAFYFVPNLSRVANSNDAWFCKHPMEEGEIQIMLNRIRLVKEIQEVFMHNPDEENY